GRQDLRHVAMLLLLGPPMDQGRTDQHDPEAVDDSGRPRAHHLLVVNDHLFERGPAPAVGFRPTDADPSARVHLAMPSQGVVPIVVIAAREFVADLGVIATVAAWRDIGFEPRPKFAAKGLGLIAVLEIHQRPPGPFPVERGLYRRSLP